MKRVVLGVFLTLVAIPLCLAQQYSAFEYVYATAGSPSVRVVTVEFKDAQGVKLKFEHDLDLRGSRGDRTLTLTSGYVKAKNQSISLKGQRGYYTSSRGRAPADVAAVLDELIELLPASGAGSDLDNDKSLQRRAVVAVLRLNQLLVGGPVGSATQRSNQTADNWQSFWAAFTAAINQRNRAALQSLMASSFSDPGEGAVRPEVWLASIDSQRVWPQVWRELQQSVAKGTKPYRDATTRRETRVTTDNSLVFERGGDGRWRWSGFMGD